ncbi:GNAT family N-acetyltransferase [Microbacterium marinilacus]|uniref:GNAT family N-acetyltransferase n=1 Tax=Microbacterium marinilacus TaxID=415209 RepID=A0ABP7BEQ1_9MICO|nr:GNAT family N-acetyltransferase [Microbacterium marinilacus]MBY0689292.1 GNAT family N-acetyltransferase [Microbacterium marinilacus]
MLASLTLPVRLSARDGGFTLREATPRDLDALIALIANDPVSAARGDVASADDREAYARGLAAIQADPSNVQLVAERDGETIATLQLTVIPGLARRGATRLQVETVRVRDDLRSAGVGGAMMRWVEDAASALEAHLIQLTSDAARVDAHRFYERLGYARSHVGFKLPVEGA